MKYAEALVVEVPGQLLSLPSSPVSRRKVELYEGMNGTNL